MRKALDVTIGSFEALQSASSNAVDVGRIQAARTELNKIEVTFNQLETELMEADKAQQRFNNDMKNGQGAAGGLLGKIKQIVITAGAAFSAKKIIDLSDTLTLTASKLDMINDGMQTTAELQEMVFQSAQRARTSYLDTAQTVGKLGILAKDAFSTNAEAVMFAELMNKQFKIGGSSLSEQTNAMYQLTQAMAAGRLQGDEFRSIMENAPLLAQSIAKEMGKSVGELRKMSAEGLITADVIKTAMFNSAEETNAKFAELPMTFAQVGTIASNVLIKAFQPALNWIGAGAQFIYDNWSTIEPIFWGLTAAVGTFAIMTGIQTTATWLAVAANRALITTMLMNPFLWIALLIGVVIAAIAKWVKAVGGISNAWTIAKNNTLNIVEGMKAGTLLLLQEMVNGGIGIINALIEKLNKIPGVSIDVIDKVTFGTAAQMEYKYNKAERIAENNAIKAQAAADADRFSWDDLLNASNTTAGNTAKMANSMETSEEELKYLRDLAEQEAINKFTTAEIKVDMGGVVNQVSKETDLDGMVAYLGEILTEEMDNIATEGVHE